MKRQPEFEEFDPNDPEFIEDMKRVDAELGEYVKKVIPELVKFGITTIVLLVFIIGLPINKIFITTLGIITMGTFFAFATHHHILFRRKINEVFKEIKEKYKI